MIILGFVVAAAGGTLVRWQASVRLGRAGGQLLVNLAGSFVLGVFVGADDTTSTVIGLAGIGSLTTFSTLVLALVELAEDSRNRALAFGLTSIVGGVSAAWFGLQLA